MGTTQRRELDLLLRTAPEAEPASISEAREHFAEIMGGLPVAGSVRQSSTTLGGRPGTLLEPHDLGRQGTILYFHGGWFVMGSPQTALAVTSNLVERTGVRAISLDYRLAPEHPFPAAIDDALAAYRELLENGTDPASIVFAGDSAGGGLTVTTCLAARDAGLPMPAAIAAFSPAVDHSFSGDSMQTKESADPFFTAQAVRSLGALYAGDADPHQALLAPAVTGDLAGLPPLLIQVGTNEILLDDALRLADRARAAQVDVILDIVSDVPHVFQAFTQALDEAGQALDRASLHLIQHLG